MSGNIKWGKRKRYEKGILESLVVSNLLGFRQENGEVTIIEEEAAIVRQIYDYFLAGHNYEYITKRLRDEGVPTKRPGATWANKTVYNILENEKYCGDCLFQKTFIESPITHNWVHPWVQNKTRPLFRMFVCTQQRSLPFYYAPTCTQFSGCRFILLIVSKLEYNAISRLLRFVQVGGFFVFRRRVYIKQGGLQPALLPP